MIEGTVLSSVAGFFNKRAKLLIIAPLALYAAVACASTPTADRASVPRISKEEVKDHLDDKDFAIIDVRILKDWDGSDIKIKNAVRENPMDIRFWSNYKDKTVVLYCA